MVFIVFSTPPIPNRCSSSSNGYDDLNLSLATFSITKQKYIKKIVYRNPMQKEGKQENIRKKIHVHNLLHPLPTLVVDYLLQ